MAYWTPAESDMRQSKITAIHHLSTAVAPQQPAEKSPQTKKGRSPADDSSPAGSEQGSGKKAKGGTSPKRPSGEGSKERGEKRDKGEKKEKKEKKNKKKKAEGGKKFVTIQRNIFVERSKSSVPADEAPVCECRVERVATDGACGARCINRMTFVECLPAHCPLGALCTNQRFQRREYAPLKRFEAGLKGHGVRCERDLRRGEFVMEYCGEVVSARTCMERLRRSRELGEHNFYILTLTANECVDAAYKGNLARFINHSCEPNCETQKWMVAGELCVGIFARCDIPAGTELTFDYQFERVGGDKQKCYCGAATCRGYLGAKKPLDEQARAERKARERDLESTGRVRALAFDQLLPVVSQPEPPPRPPKGLFLYRNVRRGYARWARELKTHMPVKERPAEREREVPLERQVKQMLAELAKDGYDLDLLK